MGLSPINQLTTDKWDIIHWKRTRGVNAMKIVGTSGECVGRCIGKEDEDIQSRIYRASYDESINPMLYNVLLQDSDFLVCFPFIWILILLGLHYTPSIT